MRKEIALGTFILVVSNLLSRVLGLARDSLLANRGGLSLDVDAYNLAFLIPDLLNHFLGAGLLPVTLIPIIMPWLKNGEYDQASQHVSRLLNVLGIIVLVGCGFAFWQMENILPLVCDHAISAELLDKTVHYSRILIFAQFFFVAGGFFNAMQYGRMKFFLPALAPLAYNGMIILVGWFTPNSTVEGFCWGVLLGSFLGSFLFQWIGAYQAGFRWHGIWEPFTRDVGVYIWRTLPFLVGASAVFSNEFVYRRFGAEDVGSIASLGFGLRISMAISGVLGGAVGVAVYPWFSKLCADGLQRTLSLELGKLLERVFVVLLPVLGVTYASSEIIIRLYLGSGNFGVAEIARQVPFLQAYLWQVVPMTVLFLVNRAYYADRRTWFPSLISVGLFLLSWPFYGLFHDYGAIRVPWISTMTTVLTVVILFGGWLWRFPGIEISKLGISFLKTLFISGLGLGMVSFALDFSVFHQERSLGLFISYSVLFAIALVIQWLLLRWSGVESAILWTDSLVQKLKKLKKSV